MCDFTTGVATSTMQHLAAIMLRTLGSSGSSRTPQVEALPGPPPTTAPEAATVPAEAAKPVRARRVRQRRKLRATPPPEAKQEPAAAPVAASRHSYICLLKDGKAPGGLAARRRDAMVTHAELWDDIQSAPSVLSFRLFAACRAAQVVVSGPEYVDAVLRRHPAIASVHEEERVVRDLAGAALKRHLLMACTKTHDRVCVVDNGGRIVGAKLSHAGTSHWHDAADGDTVAPLEEGTVDVGSDRARVCAWSAARVWSGANQAVPASTLLAALEWAARLYSKPDATSSPSSPPALYIGLSGAALLPNGAVATVLRGLEAAGFHLVLVSPLPTKWHSHKVSAAPPQPDSDQDDEDETLFG